MFNLQECFKHIRGCRNQRRARPNHAIFRDPIERVSPTIFLKAGTARLLKHFQKMRSLLKIEFIARRLVKKGKSHRIMRVRDRQPNRVMKPFERAEEMLRKRPSVRQRLYPGPCAGNKMILPCALPGQRKRTDDRVKLHQNLRAKWKSFPKPFGPRLRE